MLEKPEEAGCVQTLWEAHVVANIWCWWALTVFAPSSRAYAWMNEPCLKWNTVIYRLLRGSPSSWLRRSHNGLPARSIGCCARCFLYAGWAKKHSTFDCIYLDEQGWCWPGPVPKDRFLIKSEPFFFFILIRVTCTDTCKMCFCSLNSIILNFLQNWCWHVTCYTLN